MTGGYYAHALLVDLTAGTSQRVPLDEDLLRSTIGGVGLGTALLLRHAPAAYDPLAPEAPIVVALSPLVGTPLTTSAKFAVVSKSPLTDRINDSLSSDRFAIELKRCGVDALVIVGAAQDWCVLRIDDGAVSIDAANDLVGMPSLDAEQELRREHGEAWRFFGIGPAGEQGVRYATVSGDGRHAGRGGTGAVFGAKRLKGILARGAHPVPLADRQKVTMLAKDLSQRSLGSATAKYRELGTIANVLVLNRMGALPSRNFQEGTVDDAEAISAEAFQSGSPRIRKHCAACTIGCEHVFKSKGGKQVRLEYEGIFALGPMLGIQDRESILALAERCDALGVDVISAGGTLAFAMECAEHGLLPDAPAFGDAEGALRLLEQVGQREGALGTLLAEGSRRAAAAIGPAATRFAVHVKGLELPGYEPRALKAMGLGLAVGARGADHNRSGAYEEDFRSGGNRLVADAAKGDAAARSETRAAVLDALILCKFLRGVFEDVMAEGAEMLSAVTGWAITAEELERAGERIVTLKRLFNEREGWTRAEDTLPQRILAEPLGRGPAENNPSEGAALSASELDRMIAAYYRARGLTETGRVPASLRERLDLDRVLLRDAQEH